MPKAIEYCSRASEVTKAEISEAREVNGTCQSPLRRSNLVTYLAAPTLSTQSSILFEEVLKKMTVLGFQPFLIYPAVIKVEQISFDSPQKAEDFISFLSQQQTYADALWGGGGGTAATVSPARREELDVRDGHGPSCPGGDGGRMDMDTC